jgi:hypothetical protein
MTKAVFARAGLAKALCPTASVGRIATDRPLPSKPSCCLFSFPQQHTASMRERTGLQFVTKISAGWRRNP